MPLASPCATRKALRPATTYRALSFVETQLDNFYDKINESVTSVANSNLDSTALAPRDVEFEIAGPQPPASTRRYHRQRQPLHLQRQHSFRVRKCVLADGNQVTGFKSMVIAQFTGVSLQRDMSRKPWSSGSWVQPQPQQLHRC